MTYGCMVCTLMAQQSCSSAHLEAHSAFNYSNSTSFFWSFRMASIRLSHSWNAAARKLWSLSCFKRS